MSWFMRRRKSQISEPRIWDAHETLAHAMDDELTARRKAEELKPVIAKLERHLQDNHFSRNVWEAFRGSR
jgi:hypothetical protein